LKGGAGAVFKAKLQAARIPRRQTSANHGQREVDAGGNPAPVMTLPIRHHPSASGDGAKTRAASDATANDRPPRPAEQQSAAAQDQ